MVKIPIIHVDDWGMVYDCYTVNYTILSMLFWAWTCFCSMFNLSKPPDSLLSPCLNGFFPMFNPSKTPHICCLLLSPTMKKTGHVSTGTLLLGLLGGEGGVVLRLDGMMDAM